VKYSFHSNPNTLDLIIKLKIYITPAIQINSRNMNTNSFINSSEAKPDASSHITKSHLSGGPSQGGREIQTNVPLIAGPYELRPNVTFENMRSDMKEAAFEIAEYAVRKTYFSTKC